MSIKFNKINEFTCKHFVNVEISRQVNVNVVAVPRTYDADNDVITASKNQQTHCTFHTAHCVNVAR